MTPGRIIFILLLAIVALPDVKPLPFAVSPPYALFAGILFAFIFKPVFTGFTRKAQKFLLQASVVGLGFGMDVKEALSSGAEGMLFTVFSVVFVMLLGFLLGKLLKVEKKTSYLVSAGTAICGGSAIAAVAPVVDADEDAMSVSLGTVFLLNAAALFIFPPLGRFLELGQLEFGEWAAIAIHDTSSVVGAAAAYGDEALRTAAMIKCTRALWILPLAFFSMIVWRRKGAKVAVPWFIFLFGAAMTVNTFAGLPESVCEVFVTAAKRGFAVTLFLIGTLLGPSSFKVCGAKPLVQGVLLWFATAAASLAVIFVMS